MGQRFHIYLLLGPRGLIPTPHCQRDRNKTNGGTPYPLNKSSFCQKKKLSGNGGYAPPP